MEHTNSSLIITLSIPYNFSKIIFRQKYLTVHALISLTENIRKKLGEGNISCCIFVSLQKAFDTVKYGILLSKL